MPPEPRFVCRFAAEPPQERTPYGRWADRLRVEFLAAVLAIDSEGEDLGEAGEITWFPDRSWNGRTYVPATSRSTTGFELYGYVSYPTPEPDSEQEPSDFDSTADFTAETADRNPDWQLDLCEEVVGVWRGPEGRTAQMTLVWGRPLVTGGAAVTAELADLVVDQCELDDGRFTLLAPDDHRGDFLDIKLFSRGDRELAVESLYEEDDEDDDEEEDA